MMITIDIMQHVMGHLSLFDIIVFTETSHEVHEMMIKCDRKRVEKALKYKNFKNSLIKRINKAETRKVFYSPQLQEYIECGEDWKGNLKLFSDHCTTDRNITAVSLCWFRMNINEIVDMFIMIQEILNYRLKYFDLDIPIRSNDNINEESILPKINKQVKGPNKFTFAYYNLFLYSNKSFYIM